MKTKCYLRLILPSSNYT